MKRPPFYTARLPIRSIEEIRSLLRADHFDDSPVLKRLLRDLVRAELARRRSVAAGKGRIREAEAIELTGKWTSRDLIIAAHRLGRAMVWADDRELRAFFAGVQRLLIDELAWSLLRKIHAMEARRVRER